MQQKERSMDRTGDYYAKWNKPVSERQILYNLSYNWNLINRKQKKTPKKPSKIEPEAWKQGTDWQGPEGRGEGYKGGKKGKGLIKEQV